MEHPTFCFAITQHNAIIPLKVTNIEDYEDGYYRYRFEINHPNPSQYMKTQHRAFFEDKTVSEDCPLCDDFTSFRLTLDEAIELVKKELKKKEASLLSQLNETRNRIKSVDGKALELAEAIGLSQP